MRTYAKNLLCQHLSLQRTITLSYTFDLLLLLWLVCLLVISQWLLAMYRKKYLYIYGDIFGMHTAFHELPNRNWRLFVNEISFSRRFFHDFMVYLCVCVSVSFFVFCRLSNSNRLHRRCLSMCCVCFKHGNHVDGLFSCMELLSNNCNHLLKWKSNRMCLNANPTRVMIC